MPTMQRWRMQSLRTGWGMEAEPTAEGRKYLEQQRRAQKDKFKFCRLYECLQAMPDRVPLRKAFQLTHRAYL